MNPKKRKGLKHQPTNHTTRNYKPAPETGRVESVLRNRLKPYQTEAEQTQTFIASVNQLLLTEHKRSYKLHQYIDQFVTILKATSSFKKVRPENINQTFITEIQNHVNQMFEFSNTDQKSVDNMIAELMPLIKNQYNLEQTFTQTPYTFDYFTWLFTHDHMKTYKQHIRNMLNAYSNIHNRNCTYDDVITLAKTYAYEEMPLTPFESGFYDVLIQLLQYEKMQPKQS